MSIRKSVERVKITETRTNKQVGSSKGSSESSLRSIDDAFKCSIFDLSRMYDSVSRLLAERLRQIAAKIAEANACLERHCRHDDDVQRHIDALREEHRRLADALHDRRKAPPGIAHSTPIKKKIDKPPKRIKPNQSKSPGPKRNQSKSPGPREHQVKPTPKPIEHQRPNTNEPIKSSTIESPHQVLNQLNVTEPIITSMTESHVHYAEQDMEVLKNKKDSVNTLSPNQSPISQDDNQSSKSVSELVDKKKQGKKSDRNEQNLIDSLDNMYHENIQSIISQHKNAIDRFISEQERSYEDFIKCCNVLIDEKDAEVETLKCIITENLGRENAAAANILSGRCDKRQCNKMKKEIDNYKSHLSVLEKEREGFRIYIDKKIKEIEGPSLMQITGVNVNVRKENGNLKMEIKNERLKEKLQDVVTQMENKYVTVLQSLRNSVNDSSQRPSVSDDLHSK